jgi:hypothetical protein
LLPWGLQISHAEPFKQPIVNFIISGDGLVVAKKGPVVRFDRSFRFFTVPSEGFYLANCLVSFLLAAFNFN